MNSRIKENCLLLLPIFCIIASAYISFEFEFNQGLIPFTAQSLVIFVIAGLMSPLQLTITLIIYLLLGAFGLPVFADGTGGIERIMGPSGGFLYGFLFSGLFISSRISKTLNLKTIILIMLAGTIVLFLFGLTHLSYKIGFYAAVEFGLKPFWLMAILKALLAAIMVYFMKKWSLNESK